MLSIDLNKLFRIILVPAQISGTGCGKDLVKYNTILHQGHLKSQGQGKGALFIPMRSKCGRHRVCLPLFFTVLGFTSI